MIIYKDRIVPDEDDKEKIILDIAYGKYIHKWLELHGMSLLDVIDKLEEIRKEYSHIADTSVSELYDDFLYESGFNSNIYDTKKEFENEEYLDEEYMKELLSPEEYTEYLKIISE